MSNKKYVAVTFDDGPQETNGALLDILKEKGVKCTFFLQGNNMEKYPDLVKRIYNEGHIIGWHSYDHTVSYPNLTVDYLKEDIAKSYTILKNIGLEGYRIKYIRWPGGNYCGELETVATELGLSVINWSNYDFEDSTRQYISAKDRIELFFKDSKLPRDGELILIHPRNDKEIIRGISLLIDRLRENEFEPITVTELLKRQGGGISGKLYCTPII